eukprot:1661253-Pyramimonas_sp.AAC.1
MIDEAGATVAAASGPVPYPWQTSGAGEIWAATKALKHKSAGHITIVTDYEGLKKGWAHGYPYGCNVGH